MGSTPQRFASLVAVLLAMSNAVGNGFATVGDATTLIIDCGKAINDTRRRPTGVNLDYLMDDDRNRLLAPERTLVEALQELGPRHLRYPGGWKSAINLWSVPPFASSRPTLAGRIPDEWIRSGLQLTKADSSWNIDPLDFDEFMQVCREIGGEANLVVPYESMHWPATRDWQPPSRERLLETAAAWVRYANKVKRYGVKFWEVGNESWLNNKTWTNPIPAATYTTDLIEFARRMKAEDRTIWIGANGDSEEWWREVLTRAAAQIDFLSVHAYPCWKWSGYGDYRTNSAGILGVVKTARNAIAKYAPAHKRRLKIALTEFAAGTFGDWDKTPADLGRALITFDLQGQLLECPDVLFSEFWTTHNIYRDLNGDVFETLHRDNSLTPIGRALWIWNQFLGDEMLATTSSETIRCFATRRSNREVTLFLANKDTAPREATVKLRRLPKPLRHGEQWALRGGGPQDREPAWDRVAAVRVNQSGLFLRLDPVSISVVRLRGD